MARQRWIHPDFWTDPAIGKLTPVDRLFFIGCFSNADDDGRLLGDPAYLRSVIFPYDDLRVADVRAMRDRVVAICHNLVLYTVNGMDCLAFRHWKRYQNPRYPKASKLPPPPDTVAAKSPQTCSEMDASLREDGSCGLGRDGLGRDGLINTHTVSADAQTDSDPATPQDPKKAKPQAEYSQDFLAFWNAYPRKVNKRGAYRCWRARLKERVESGEPVTPEMLITAGRVYAVECARERRAPEYIKHPSTFLSRDHPFAEYLARPLPPAGGEHCAKPADSAAQGARDWYGRFGRPADVPGVRESDRTNDGPDPGPKPDRVPGVPVRDRRALP